MEGVHLNIEKYEKLQIRQVILGPMYLLLVRVGISLSLSQSI